MLRSHGGPVELEQPTAVEDAVDDCLGEVVVVQHGAPALGVLVGREEHRATADVPLVDHVEQHVRRVVPVREVPHLVHDQHVRLEVPRQRLAHLPGATRARQVVDQLRAVGEQRVEPVLHRAVRDGHREVRLPAARRAVQDRAVAFGHEVRREQ
jgi:hypothetical protein